MSISKQKPVHDTQDIKFTQFWSMLGFVWCYDTESQNGRGWNGPLGPSGPITAPAGTPRAVYPAPCLHGFWRSPSGILHNFSGQPVRVLQLCIAQKCFLVLRGKLLRFSLCPLPPDLALGTNEKSLAPSSLHAPIRNV